MSQFHHLLHLPSSQGIGTTSYEGFERTLHCAPIEFLLRGTSSWKLRCSTSIPPSSSSTVLPPIPGRPAVPLPKKLFLQLDNSAKDNKNQYVMAFCSLLTARRVFKEVTVGFLVFGHTHEDIDAHFNYLSKPLKMKNT